MYSDVQIAQYILSKDPQRVLFDKELVNKNGRTFYRGNARLNKYLHMAQNLYIAKTGQKLFEEDMYAYDNGAVAVNVQENYSILLTKKMTMDLPLPIKDFLNRLCKALENATLDELIELSHEDSEWVDKHRFYSKQEQKMDSLSRAAEYNHQYNDMINVMERMAL